MLGNYILDEDGNPKLEVDLLKWASWFGSSFQKRIIKRDYFFFGAIIVSTVFLGLDHSYSADSNAPPILYETMVFGKKFFYEEYQERYSTKTQALDGHAKAVKWVKRRWYKYWFLAAVAFSKWLWLPSR